MANKDNDIKLINISTKKHPRSFAIVDADDYEALNRYKWHLTGNKTVVRVVYFNKDGCKKKKKVQMKREVFCADDTIRVRHINRSPLDCRRNNLARGGGVRVVPNIIPDVLSDGARLIDVSTKSFPECRAIVDADDYDIASKNKWTVTRLGYAVRTKSPFDSGSRAVFLHRLILKLDDMNGVFVDHIDGNKLNNKKSNLRIASISENNRNKKGYSPSGYKGAYRHRKKWVSSIRVKGKSIYLGIFDTAELAHAAYCKASEYYHGEFSNTGHQFKECKK